MRQIFHIDIWFMLTSTEVNVLVTYEQKKNPTFYMVHNMK